MIPTIKKASLADVEIITPLFDAYRVFYEQATDITAAANFLSERLSKNESVIFIAFMNSEAVGFIQLYPIFSSVSLRATWLLNDLYVAGNARQQGVAAALLNQAKLFGIQSNAKWLLLETAADNFTAQSVYEKNGWIKQTDFFYQLPLDT
ncbi:MAG: family N-acetyltransferase [Ferruginibacter sp.]|jgi:GNAT superfamily N-acetyltransferase|uniref:GNAT family N-acetyltransferase n=1 Tax=Ferruginibacter sp. TaxID=1940288 RepID=UPI0026597DDE|nr:GNAT family N-acetyltransferase [Ferruginibacter sp.]MDB5277065.1 family N-acetyltransferase [Ferruginibacter sp.]